MGRTLWVTERQRSPHRKNIQCQRPLDFYSRSGCFTHCYVDTAEPYSSSIQGRKKNQKQKQVHLTTQGTSNQRLSPGSVQSKMFTLCVFPLPVPCSWAWRREWGTGVGVVGAAGGWALSAKPTSSWEVRRGWRQSTYRGSGRVQKQRRNEFYRANIATNRSLMQESEGKNRWEEGRQRGDMDGETVEVGGYPYCCQALSG